MNSLYEFLPPGALIQRADRPFPLMVLVAPHAACQSMLALAARLALYTPVRVLDGGNRFNAREVARLLRHLHAPDLYQALEQIQVARAFTCYQMTALLEDIPLSSRPTLVIDLLDTFYAESAPLVERLRLAERCMLRLRSLSDQAPAALSVRPPPPSRQDPTGLLEIVQNAADTLWLQEEDPASQDPTSRFSPPTLKLF